MTTFAELMSAISGAPPAGPIEQRFALEFGEADKSEPGLIRKLDGTVWFVNPDGTEGRIGGGGVWKTYGVDSAYGVDPPWLSPFDNVTVADGVVTAKWWTPAPVVASPDTEPFLCYASVGFYLGASTTIDAEMRFAWPRFVDGTGYNIAPVNVGVLDGVFTGVIAAEADIGGVLTFFPGTILFAHVFGPDGLPWDATHPFVWADASAPPFLSASVMTLAQFVPH